MAYCYGCKAIVDLISQEGIEQMSSMIISFEQMKRIVEDQYQKDADEWELTSFIA